MLRKRITSFGWSALVSAALIAGSAPGAFGQWMGQYGPEIAPVGAYRAGIPVGLWTVYPSLFAGAVYDTNTSQLASAVGGNRGVSARLVPNLTALYNTPFQQTTLYGVADARFFDSKNVAATAGVSHSYEPTRDIILNVQGNYTRQTDVFNSALNFNNGAIGPTTSPGSSAPLFINPFGTTPGVNPVAYNQFTGAGYATKKFGADDRAFVTVNGAAYYIAYDHGDNLGVTNPFLGVNDPFQTSRDGANYQAGGRVGFHLVPSIYVFADGQGIFQRFKNTLFDTNGYRVVGGIGSDDPKSLLTGEIYGGYQAQHETSDQVINGIGIPGVNTPLNVPSGIPQNLDSSVFGGRVYYFPTRRLSFLAQVDETLGMATVFQPTVPAGTPTRSITSLLQANYLLSYTLTVGARFGYTRANFIGIDKLDNGYMAGASLNYEVWRNLMFTLDYQYTTVHSTAAFSDFKRNVYTAGLTYRY